MNFNFYNFTIITALVLIVSFAGVSRAEEGISYVATESLREPLAAGKNIFVVSACPEGTRIIGGGGECYGFLATEHKIVLTVSTADPSSNVWKVSCTNMNNNPGDAQARAWAICGDSKLLELDKKK